MKIILFLICLLSVIMGASAVKIDLACTALCGNFWACLAKHIGTYKCQEPAGCQCRKFA